MGSLKTTAILIGLGLIVAAYWWIGSGELGTGDQQPAGTIPGPAGGAHPSPSVVATGAPGRGDPAGQQGARGKAPNTQQPIPSQGRLEAGAGQPAPARPSNLPPLVLVSPASIIPENVVTVSGQGFEPAETIDITTGLSGTAAASATADKEGSFYGVPITVTSGTPAGSYTVSASGRRSVRQAQVELTVEAGMPYGDPSTYSGKGSSVVSFEGGGFRPGEVVSLHFDSLAIDPLQQVIAASDGSVVISGTVPLVDPGDHAFLLIGEQSNAPLRVPFTVVAFSPWMSPTSYTSTPQQLVGFAGHDFAPTEEVRIFREKVADRPIALARANADGAFELADAYELPVDSVGSNLFVAMGIHSRAVVSATVEVLPFDPGLELSAYAGRAGSEVSFKGTGYARGETITAYLGGANGGREVARFNAGDDGSFEQAGSFKIPPDAKEGSLTVTAVGEHSQTPREISFAVLPFPTWAGLTRYAGPPGTSLSFEGHDFLPGEQVAIHLGDRQAPILATVQADESGNFLGGGKYSVPQDAEERIEFTFVGETSGASATATFVVTPEEIEGEQETTPTPNAGAEEQ